MTAKPTLGRDGGRFMMIKLTFGKLELAINSGRKSGRPKKTIITRLRVAINQLIKLIRDKRYAGHPLSRVFRHVFENKKAKRILGLNLTVIAIFTGVYGVPISAFSDNPQNEITALNPAIVELTTAHSVRVPLDSFEVTQGYGFFHRGVDLNGELGEPVYPLMDGRVEVVAYGRFSYGNHLIIDHGSGFKSLYAHLAKIVVEENETVDKNTVIGTIGTSGWATGSHLHLEVYDNGQTFNPLTILK
jgi:murein DD-endopeptidase MepM/ murein hydrolase activator NlpD